MAKFTITKRVASFDMIKCGDCSSGKTTPPFFDYTIKKTPSFKNMALDMKQGPFLWGSAFKSLLGRFWKLYFYWTIRKNFYKIFYIFPI